MTGSLTSFAQFYHQETKYSPENIAQASHRLDWDNQPIPFKIYPDNCEQIDLSAYVPLSTNPFSEACLKRATQWTDAEKPLAELSRLLYFANGITAIVPYPPNPLLMRAAPSAGGLYPNEIYVIARNYPGVGSGVFNYQVKTHSLAKIAEGEVQYEKLSSLVMNHPSLEESDLAFVITGVFSRSAWRYQDRAYRRILLDAGHILGNLDLTSFNFGRKAYVLGGFDDDRLNELLKLDEDEQSLFVVALPTIQNCKNISLTETPTALPSRIVEMDSIIPAGERIKALHNCSKINFSGSSSTNLLDLTLKDYREQPQDSRLECFLQSESLQCKPINWDKCSLMTTILERRSTRKYCPEVALTKEQVSQILQFAYNPECYEHSCFDTNPVFLCPDLLKTYVVVNNVDGLEPGCYLYQAEQKVLRQTRFKELRTEAHQLCLGQELGRDAAALVFHTCDLGRAVKIFGERVYRYLHLDAGHYGQRMNLAAVKLGLGVSGIGGFFDDIANESLGIAPDHIIVYITTLGTPFHDFTEG